MNDIEHFVKIEPGYDCGGPSGCAFGKPDCEPGSGGFHGLHGATMRFVVRGELGAVTFTIFTNWFPRETKERVERAFKPRSMLLTDGQHASTLFGPMPADLGYHWTRESASQFILKSSLYSEHCDILDGKECYYDGSGLAAETIFELMLKEGDEGLWNRLIDLYADQIVNAKSKV